MKLTMEASRPNTFTSLPAGQANFTDSSCCGCGEEERREAGGAGWSTKTSRQIFATKRRKKATQRRMQMIPFFAVTCGVSTGFSGTGVMIVENEDRLDSFNLQNREVRSGCCVWVMFKLVLCYCWRLTLNLTLTLTFIFSLKNALQ